MTRVSATGFLSGGFTQKKRVSPYWSWSVSPWRNVKVKSSEHGVSGGCAPSTISAGAPPPAPDAAVTGEGDCSEPPLRRRRLLFWLLVLTGTRRCDPFPGKGANRDGFNEI
jgi:hypothetical protein